MCCWDLEGSLVWEKNLELEGVEGSNTDVWKLLSNADGGVSIVSGGNSVEIETFTTEGEFKERISLSTMSLTELILIHSSTGTNRKNFLKLALMLMLKLRSLPVILLMQQLKALTIVIILMIRLNSRFLLITLLI